MSVVYAPTKLWRCAKYAENALRAHFTCDLWKNGTWHLFFDFRNGFSDLKLVQNRVSLVWLIFRVRFVGQCNYWGHTSIDQQSFTEINKTSTILMKIDVCGRL